MVLDGPSVHPLSRAFQRFEAFCGARGARPFPFACSDEFRFIYLVIGNEKDPTLTELTIETRAMASKMVFLCALSVLLLAAGKVAAFNSPQGTPRSQQRIIRRHDDDHHALCMAKTKKPETADQKESRASITEEEQHSRLEEEPCNVVFTHTNADFDSLAAAVALSLLWSHQQPSLPTHVVLPRGVHPIVQRFLAFHKHLLPIRGFKTILAEDVHAIGVVDAQQVSRIGRGKSWLETARSIHVFDHHDPGGDDESNKKDPNSLINLATELVIEKVGSTTTLLVERLRDAGIKPAPHEATLFVLGIRADTGGLVYESTTIRDAEALLWCLQNGASQKGISEFGVARVSENQRRVLNEALRYTKTETVRGCQVSSVLVQTNNEYVAGLAHVCEELLDLTDSDVFLLGATHSSGKNNKRKKSGGAGQQQWVSLIGRCSPRAVGVDLNQVMRSFGGGGHPKAAAAAVRCDPEPIEEDTDDSAASSLLPPSESSSARAVLASAMRQIESQIPEQLVASSIMVPSDRVVCISADATVHEARQLFDANNLKSAPVVDVSDGKTKKHRGSLKLSDLVNASRKGKSQDKIRGMMRSTVETVLPETPLAALEEFLVDKGVGRLPVVDDEGTLLGIVTRTDVLRQHKMYGED